MTRKLLISISLILTGICAAAATDVPEDVALLQKARTLMTEERTRWQRLHETPYTDQVTLIQEKNTLIIDITIDPKVSNIINSKPLTRRYTFESETQKRPWYCPQFGGVIAHAAFSGFRPGAYCAWGIPVITRGTYTGYAAAGPYTTGHSTGIALAYRDNAWYTVSILITIGCTLKGSIEPGLAIGAGW